MPFRTDDPHAFVTHTFSECVENHAGMQKIGTKRKRGFEQTHLEACHEKHGGVLHHLQHEDDSAVVWVIPNGVNKLMGANGADALHAESLAQPFDTRYYDAKKKKVFTKHGRQNNCYADEAQAPDVDHGKGTVIAFDTAPQMQELRAKLPTLLGDEAKGLYAETNLYTDVRKLEVGIGFHGDTERSLVVGVRLGRASLPLRFQWFHKSKAVGAEHQIPLHHGDMYAMSWKATGHDWRFSSLTTLRHGVGRKAALTKKQRGE